MTIQEDNSDNGGSTEDISTTQRGRISTEEFIALIQASAEDEYEAGREARELDTAKRRIAFDELVALGVSIESARLMANYYEE